MPDKFDPVHNLLAREGKREGALRDLAAAMTALQEAVSNYRDAHKACPSVCLRQALRAVQERV